MLTATIIAQTETMKPFLGGMYFAVALRAIDQHDAATADTYLRLATNVLHNTAERHQLVGRIATLWAMQHEPGVRAGFVTKALDAMSRQPAWFGKVIHDFLGGVHIAWAFEAYQAGHRMGVESHALQGLFHNPGALRNHGVLSIMARSLFQRQRNHHDSFDGKAATAPLAIAEARVGAALRRPVQRIHEISRSNSADHIFRVDLGDEVVVARLAKQEQVAQPNFVLAQAQAAGVPAPMLLAELPASATQPALSIEQLMPGVTLDSRTDTRLDFWVEPISQMLRQLHSVQVASFGILSAVGDHAHHQTHQDWLTELQFRVQMACLYDAAPIESLPHLDEAMQHLTCAPYTGLPILTHCDLSDSNILVAGDAITGLIDWADAEGNDPARDLGVLLAHNADIWFAHAHEAFPVKLVQSYLQGWDESFYHKVIAHMLLHSAVYLQWLCCTQTPDPLFPILKALLTQAHPFEHSKAAATP